MITSKDTAKLSDRLAEELQQYIGSFLEQLDVLLDKRLVRTLLQTMIAIIQHRHRACGLLLSELGAYILSPSQAPAGTKRLSRLLRSSKWSHHIIERYLWRCSKERLEALEQKGDQALLLWDESVLEKPESIALEGLCAVRSSKARRLKRIKPGYFNPPGGRPVFVPGLNWMGLVLVGMRGRMTLAALRWWTSRGERKEEKRDVALALLKKAHMAWGRRLWHIFDRGYAGSPWLGQLLKYQVRFVLRWPSRYKLIDEQGQLRNAWKIARGKRSWGKRKVWDARKRCWRNTGIIAFAVRHEHYDEPLYLVISRPGKGRKPWYLLTSEPVHNEKQAWRIVFAYARRWQVEMAWRYSKSELAMQSPRLWFWDNRLKLLMIVALVYAFLLWMLRPAMDELRTQLLRAWCHRTGKRSRDCSTPLYRIRLALSRLWVTHPPNLAFPFQNSG